MSCVSQPVWLPLGATWHYEFSSYSGYGVAKVVVAEETTTGGQTSKKLLSETIVVSYNDIDTFYEVFYAGEDSSVVNGFDPTAQLYQTLYDFTAEVGDTLNMFFGGISPDIFIVDSIGVVEMEGIPFTFQDIRYRNSESGNPNWYGMRVFEVIGPLYSHFFHSRLVLNPPDAGDYFLRCYEDPVVGLLNVSQPLVDCNFIDGITSIGEAEGEKIAMYPNPADDFIRVEVSHKTFTRLIVVDIMGRTRSSHLVSNASSTLIDVSNLESGNFYLAGQDEFGNINLIERIIKL